MPAWVVKSELAPVAASVMLPGPATGELTVRLPLEVIWMFPDAPVTCAPLNVRLRAPVLLTKMPPVAVPAYRLVAEVWMLWMAVPMPVPACSVRLTTANEPAADWVIAFDVLRASHG